MSIAVCPSCGDDVRVPGNPKIGQKVSCPYCDAALEVIELDPVELDWAYEEEDWDEDWEEGWEEEEYGH
jgi:lysine biosynthesis protein LysW